MLIANLGRARRKLLASLDDVSDEHLNESPSNSRWSIGQIVCHLCNTEKGIVETVLAALPSSSGKVEERDVSLLIEPYESRQAKTAPQMGSLTKAELIRLLEESRFKYLQYVFNKAHEYSLAEKAVYHPLFGQISLKNLIDFIWLHEQYHIDQIEETKKSLECPTNPAI